MIGTAVVLLNGRPYLVGRFLFRKVELQMKISQLSLIDE